MPSHWTELIIDCHDAARLATFWCAVRGYRQLDEGEGIIEIGADLPSGEDVIRGPICPTILFIPVPEGKTVKNRLHMDLRPVGISQADEVDRLLALGARRAYVGQGPDVSWVVMVDPEGNEFCVLSNVAGDPAIAGIAAR